MLACGCSFVQIKHKRLGRFIREHGLHEKTVVLGKDKIHYWQGGSGKPLLLIHGFGADATWGWYPQIEALAKQFHLIVPDLLWFGESSSEDPDYSLDHQVQAIENLMNHLGFARYDVAGISYGGALAYVMASKLPEQVNRTVIVASPGPVYKRADYEAMLKRFAIHSVADLIVPQTSDGLIRVLEIAYHKPPYIPWLYRQDVIDLVIAPNRQEKVQLLGRLIADLDSIASRYQKIEHPILLVWGEDDPLFPLELGKRFNEFLGTKGELKVMRKARHAPNLEYAKEFNRLTVEFLHR